MSSAAAAPKAEQAPASEAPVAPVRASAPSNYARFQNALRDKMEAAPDRAFAVALVNLDNFHRVNAKYGVLVADLVLRETAHRLIGLSRGDVAVTRINGDEFAVAIADAQPASLDDYGRRILAQLAAPIHVAARDVQVTASVGIALGVGPACAEALVGEADLAMRAAKTAGGACYRARRIARERTQRAFDVRDLEHAIKHGKINLALQPIFDAKTSEVRLAEVLARWEHPGHGAVAPVDFIGLAERHGLIGDLGWQVMSQAVAILKRDPRFKLAVNVSPLQLRAHDFGLRVQDIICAEQIAPEQLEIEVTESSLIENFETAERTLRQLRAIGVGVALDDFGSGYSSLGYLQRLNVDKVKLDQSFIRGKSHQGANVRFLRAIVDLAHSLGAVIVAEGVETRAQASMLQLIGCDLLQGYGLGSPVGREEFAKLYLS